MRLPPSPASQWARRRNREPIQLTESERLLLIEAYKRHKTYGGAARERKVDRATARHWVKLWQATNSVISNTDRYQKKSTFHPLLLKIH